MGQHDPTPELWMLEREINEGRITHDGALSFCDSTFARVDSINKTIAEMRESGLEVPTADQQRALKNIHEGVCKWLRRTPTEAECRDEMLAHPHSDSPYTSYKTKDSPPHSKQVRKVKHYPKY